MNGYMKPSTFWAMITYAALLFLMCLMAKLTWQPFVLFVVIVSAVIEWGIEQRWRDRFHVVILYWKISFIDGELSGVRREINDSRAIGEEEDAQALQQYYVDRIRDRQRLRERITELRYALDGATEGLDYPDI